MTEPVGPPLGTLARIIHLGLSAGLVVFVAGAWSLGQSAPGGVLPDLVLYLPLVVGAVVFAGAIVLRSRLLDSDGPGGDEWWRANLQRVILLWALFEAPALFGTAIYFVSRQWIPLVPTAVGFLFLVLHSPGQLRPE